MGTVEEEPTWTDHGLDQVRLVYFLRFFRASLEYRSSPAHVLPLGSYSRERASLKTVLQQQQFLLNPIKKITSVLMYISQCYFIHHFAPCANIETV